MLLVGLALQFPHTVAIAEPANPTPRPAKPAATKASQQHLTQALIAAAREGQTAQAKLLLDQGADVNGRGNSSHPRYGHYTSIPLIEAASSGKLDLVRLLLARGAHINALCEGNETALMHASESGDPAMMQLLLAHGANVQMLDGYNRTAMFYAITSCSVPCVKLLRQHGVSLQDKPAQKGMRFAIELCDEGQEKKVLAILKYLLDNGANVNARGFEEFGDSETILMIACGAPHGRESYSVEAPKVVKLLLAHKANVHLRDGEGNTALFYAKENENKGIIQMLKKAGAKK